MKEIDEIASMIDHSLLHPTMTDQQLKDGCLLANKYKVASVCIKPYAVKMAAKWLKKSPVLVGTVIGFPHGNSSIEVKVAETLQACKDGAVEIDMVVNIGKVLSEDWDYVLNEIKAVTFACHQNKAIVKVIFENDFLPEDHYKIKLCELCAEAMADYVKTSSGFGFIKGTDGKYSYQGATIPDLQLMRKHSPSTVKVKAAGGIRTLDELLQAKEIGVSRVGASATESIMQEAYKRFSKNR